MKDFYFEDAELLFQDFPVGILSGEINISGIFEKAYIENISGEKFIQTYAVSPIISLPLKEKSAEFKKLISEPDVKPLLKHLVTDFGTLLIRGQYQSFTIPEVFWTRFPTTGFQLKHNTEEFILSVNIFQQN